MSYLSIKKYRILPKESFVIVRNCPGCGGKARYHNTNCFRVNANGNKVDVWLIYQCMHCRHTYNMAIYERKNPKAIPEKEYAAFLANDSKLASWYGRNRAIFGRNKAVIDQTSISYELKPLAVLNEERKDGEEAQIQILLDNPYHIKVRVDKVLSEILPITRSKVKKMQNDRRLTVVEENQQITIKIYD